MAFRHLLLVCIFLMTAFLPAGEPGRGSGFGEPTRRWIPAGPANVDAVTGQMRLSLPIGPTLPGRIPMGFIWHTEGVGASFDAYQWPTWDSTQSATWVAMTLGNEKVTFYRGAPADATATTAEVQKWYQDRGLSTGQEKVGSLEPGYTAYMGTTVFTSSDGASHLVVSAWYVRPPDPPKPWRPDTVWPPADPRVFAAQMAVVQGDTVIWASFEDGTGQGIQQKARPSTEIRNRWGDWVRFDKTLEPIADALVGATLTSSLGHSLTLEGSGSSWSIRNSMGLPKIQMTSVGEAWQGQSLTSVSREGLTGNDWTLTWLAGNPRLSAIESRSGSKVEYQWAGTNVPSVDGIPIPANECFGPDGKWKGFEPVTYTSTGNVQIGELLPAVKTVKFSSTKAGEPGGSLLEFIRTFPKPASYDTTTKTIVWSTTAYQTDIRIHPQPDPGTSYRFTRLIHAKPIGVFGAPDPALGQSLNDQRQMVLFALSTVVQEQQGTMSGTSEVIRKRVIHDGWTLKGPMNANGEVAGSGVINPVPTRTTVELPQGDGPTLTSERLDWDGRVFRTQRQITSPSALTAYDGTGKPERPVWRGSTLPDGDQTTGGIVRTGTVSATWNSDLALLLKQSSASTVGGSNYPAFRGVASADLGTKSYDYDPLGRPTLTKGITGGYTSTLEQTPVGDRPEVASTIRRVTGPSGASPLSGQVGEEYTYSGLWRTGVRQKPDPRWATEMRDGLGRMTASVSTEGVRTAIHYDEFGRAWKTVREAKGSVPALTAWQEWDVAGRWVREHSQGNDGSDLVKETRVDAFGRVLSVTTAKGTAAERTVYFEYDGYGQKVRESLPTKAGGTPRFSETSYDADGFVLQTKNTRGAVTATFLRPTAGTLDGRAGYLFITQLRRRVGTSEQSVVQSALKDELGQVIRSTDGLGQLTKLAYDAFGRLKEVSRGGQIRSYLYNDMGWLLSQTQPEEGTTVFENHTVTGQALRITKGTGANATTIITDLYPAGGPSEGLVMAVTASGLGSTVSTTLAYDGQRRLKNRIETQANGTITESYGYDDLSRLREKITSDGVVSFTVSRDFDAFGKVRRLYYPAQSGTSGRSVVQTYDALHRPKSVAFGATDAESHVASMEYDQTINGEEGERLTYANAATTTWQRNGDQELSRVIHGVGGSTIEDASVAWSNDGRMISRGADAFEYDMLGRLTKATISGVNGERAQQTFGYDFYGNRTFVGSTALSGSLPAEAVSYQLSIGTDNRLPATTLAGVNTGALYDAQGRMSQVWAVPGDTSTLTSWTYDALGRVVGQGGAAAYAESYLLDGEGLRFKRTKADGTVQFTVYGFTREPLRTFPVGPTSRTMVYGFGQMLGEERPTGMIYQQGDHLGTPGVLTNASGAVVGRQKSLPFGERMSGTGEKSLRRFTNHEDGAQLPIYMQARMYLPTYGRFAQVDPAYDHSEDGLNLYSYTSNQPITRSDPDGMRDVGGGGGGGPHTPLTLEAPHDWDSPIPGTVSWWVIRTGGTGYFGNPAPSSFSMEYSAASSALLDLATGGNGDPAWMATNKDNFDDYGQYNFTKDNLADYIYGSGSEEINSRLRVVNKGTDQIKISINNDGKTASRPVPVDGKIYWNITIDIAKLGGSLKSLLRVAVHELQHGVDFVIKAGGNMEAWRKLSNDSIRYMEQVNMAKGALRYEMRPQQRGEIQSLLYRYESLYQNTPVERNAADAVRSLWREQGW